MFRCVYHLINCRSRWRQLIFLLFFFSFFTYLFIYLNFSRKKLALSSTIVLSTRSSVHTHDFRLYPSSQSDIEYKYIQIDNENINSMFFIDDKKQHTKNLDYSKPLEYSESTFRSASVPIIWLDVHGDIHWNRIAQYEILNYLLEKQFPSNISKTNLTSIINNCLSRQLIMLEQWSMGFFSRYHCLIEQFGQTLYSPSMVLLIPRTFVVSRSSRDDFKQEGIIRYFQPMSLCSAYINYPQMESIREMLLTVNIPGKNRKTIHRIDQLLERDEQKIKYVYSREIWKFGYDHVPHRRWLFDRNRHEIKKILNYNSPISLLINHSNEHIYYYHGPLLNLSSWTSRNLPQGPPKEVLNGK